MAAKKPVSRSKQKPKQPVVSSGFLPNRFNLSSRSLLTLAVGFGLVGVIYLAASFATPDTKIVRFKEDKGRGLVWKGLVARENGPCAKVFEVFDDKGKSQGCTHGPDPAPEGVDVLTPSQPVNSGDVAPEAATVGGTFCDGDGVAGKRIQLIYARASDRTDRYSTLGSTFQNIASNMNNVFVESGNQTGSPRSIRFVSNPDCTVNIPSVTLSVTGDDSVGNTRSELSAMGYSRTDRKYMIIADANVYCGISYTAGTSSPDPSNPANNGPTFSRVDSGCWNSINSVESHELVHALGGVQSDAPHSNKAWHCFDEYDRMCYNDGSGVQMQYICPSTDESRLDCGKDDYFNTSTSIPSTNYLFNHWNIANSVFLISGVPITPTPDPTPPPPPNPTDIVLPTVVINAPAAGSTIGNRVSISATATDNVSVVKLEIYVDNQLRTTSTTSNASTNWNSRKASKGTHSITAKAYDAAGNVGQTTIYVTK